MQKPERTTAAGLTIEHLVHEEVVIIRLAGKSLGGHQTEMFYGKINEYLAKNHIKFVLNFQNLQWMISAGLGMFIYAQVLIKKANGRMVFCNLSEKVESVLTITKLIDVFEHYYTEDEAIQSFDH